MIGTLQSSMANIDAEPYGSDVPIVQGSDNLDNIKFLSNNEKFKTVLLNGYL